MPLRRCVRPMGIAFSGAHICREDEKTDSVFWEEPVDPCEAERGGAGRVAGRLDSVAELRPPPTEPRNHCWLGPLIFPRQSLTVTVTIDIILSILLMSNLYDLRIKLSESLEWFGVGPFFRVSSAGEQFYPVACVETICGQLEKEKKKRRSNTSPPKKKNLCASLELRKQLIP